MKYYLYLLGAILGTVVVFSLLDFLATGGLFVRIIYHLLLDILMPNRIKK